MLVGVLLLLAAQDGGIRCDPNGPQQAMNACARDDYAKADAALNRQWKLTMAEMKRRDAAYAPRDGRPSNAEALLAAQRAWIAYRDSECAIEGYAMRGGSAEPLLVLGCKAHLTEQRTKALAELLER